MDICEQSELEVDFLAFEVMMHQKDSGGIADYDKARNDAVRIIKQDRAETRNGQK